MTRENTEYSLDVLVRVAPPVSFAELSRIRKAYSTPPRIVITKIVINPKSL